MMVVDPLTEEESRRFAAYLRQHADTMDVMAHEMEKISDDPPGDPTREVLAKRMRKVARANRTTAENLPL